ncbi:DUF3305 domain-containing protein [Undibacterium arcticum]|uniref:DUF3305 domain-containing protein n=1 Tax=Undibacterium arcticum TaxID=1762892 RepID=A0ABV7F672_9BURK
METEAITVGVVMQRRSLHNRWQSQQWRPLEVTSDLGAAQRSALCLRNGSADGDVGDDMRWLFPGFDIKLFSDEAEGYFLNISAALPCWFIMWRMEPIDDLDVAVPKTVTLSYNEAARLMDGGEQVDTLPASSDIIEWLAAFVAEHYRPEPKHKRKKPSFEGGAAVEQMAKAEGSGHGG